MNAMIIHSSLIIGNSRLLVAALLDTMDGRQGITIDAHSYDLSRVSVPNGSSTETAKNQNQHRRQQ